MNSDLTTCQLGTSHRIIPASLPLLTAHLAPAGAERWSAPKVLVFTPSIISAINPPFHAPEATVCSALAAFTEVLAAELRPLAIPVTHVQLGTFDISGFTPVRSPRGLLPPASQPDASDTAAWSPGARSAYGRNFSAQSSSAIAGAGRGKALRGSSLRHLHCAVFDVIDGSVTSGTVRVGLGASVYGLVGRWLPRGAGAGMMGVRRVDELAAWTARASSEDGSDEGSRGAVSEGSEGQDYVAVTPDGGASVWR